jgi:hypothetical protein
MPPLRSGPAGPAGASHGELTLDQGMLYGAGVDRKVYAVDLETGAVKWSSRLTGIVAGGVIVSGDTVYVASTRRRAGQRARPQHRSADLARQRGWYPPRSPWSIERFWSRTSGRAPWSRSQERGSPLAAADRAGLHRADSRGFRRGVLATPDSLFPHRYRRWRRSAAGARAGRRGIALDPDARRAGGGNGGFARPRRGS